MSPQSWQVRDAALRSPTVPGPGGELFPGNTACRQRPAGSHAPWGGGVRYNQRGVVVEEERSCCKQGLDPSRRPSGAGLVTDQRVSLHLLFFGTLALEPLPSC